MPGPVQCSLQRSIYQASGRKTHCHFIWNKVETMAWFHLTNQILHTFSQKWVQYLWRLNFTSLKCMQTLLMSLVKSRVTGFVGLFRSETLCKAEKEMKLDRNPLTNYFGTSAEIANRLLSHCLKTDALPSSSAMTPHLDLHQTTIVNGNGPGHQLLEM